MSAAKRLMMLLGGVATAPMAVALNTTSATGASFNSEITSNIVSATVSGGTAPYTYAWTVTTSDGIVALNPTSPSTAFRKTGGVAGSTYSGTAVLTVTDSAAVVRVSATVNISLRCREDPTGGTGTL